MWLAANWSVVATDLEAGLVHPQNIREWHRDQEVANQLPPDLQDLPIESKPTIELDTRSAERIAKVLNRANSGGEGSDIAKKHAQFVPTES